MLAYSIIMISCALIFLAFSVAIYRGNIGLIHDYHRTKVTDSANYAKAFAKALGSMAAAFFLSGIISLTENSSQMIPLSIAVLFFGLIIGVVWLLHVQKKYNGGMF